MCAMLYFVDSCGVDDLTAVVARTTQAPVENLLAAFADRVGSIPNIVFHDQHRCCQHLRNEMRIYVDGVFLQQLSGGS